MGTVWSQHLAGYVFTQKQESTMCLAEDNVLRTLAQELWSSAVCVGCLLSDMVRRALQRGTPFRHHVFQGLSWFLLFHFLFYLDQWPESKKQPCIIVVNAERCVKSWGICCLLCHALASSQKSAITVICKWPAICCAQIPLGFLSLLIIYFKIRYNQHFCFPK